MELATFKRSALVQATNGEMAIIYVGPERKRYDVHKDLLTKQSEFFEKAFNGMFKEAEENSIYLEEESPAAFELLLDLLYKGHVRAIGPPFGGFKAPEADVAVRDPLAPGTILQLETPGGTSYRRMIGPTNVDVYMTTVSEITPPKNEGTSKVPYQPHTEQATGPLPSVNQTVGALDLFTSICAQRQYRKWSPEELRLADYEGNAISSPHTSLEEIIADLSSISNALSSSPAATSTFTLPRGTRLAGIPHSAPLTAVTEKEESHQLALLNLCLLAETLCWPSIFNAAMSAYLLGEATLSSRRPLPSSHIALIYTRAHASSPVRLFAADAAASYLQYGEAAQTMYAELGLEFPAFLSDVFATLGRMMKDLPLGEKELGWVWKGACPAYHVHGEGERCVRDCLDEELRKDGAGQRGLFGRVAEDRAEGGAQGVQTRQWMDWRDVAAVLYRPLEDI